MILPAIIWALLLVGCITYCGWALFVGIPADLSDLFKIQLEQLRQDAVDAARSETTESAASQIHQAAAWCETVEKVAAYVTLATATTLMVFVLAIALFATRSKSTEESHSQPLASSKFTVRILKLLGWRMITGSPIGWVTGTFLAIVFGPMWAVSRTTGFCSKQWRWATRAVVAGANRAATMIQSLSLLPSGSALPQYLSLRF